MKRDWRHCAQKNRMKIKKMGAKYRRKVQGRVVFKSPDSCLELKKSEG